jgi:hypothetical protein
MILSETTMPRSEALKPEPVPADSKPTFGTFTQSPQI